MTTNENTPSPPPGPEAWVREAIAQQEEYLRRIRACPTGGANHSWDWFAPRPGVRIEQCWRCAVTRTDEGYQQMLAARE